MQAAAFSFASMGAFTFAGEVVNGIVNTITAGAQLAADAVFALTTAVKAGVHGLVGGALAVAQGGNFLQGFIGSAAGAVGGQFAQGVFGDYGTGDFGNVVGRAAISAAVGCAGASLSGGKCANGAVTAAFASLFNGDRGARWGRRVGAVLGGAAGAVIGKTPASIGWGAASGAAVGAKLGDSVEDLLIKGTPTIGVLYTPDGQVKFFSSGGGRRGLPIPYGHAEGKAALWMAKNQVFRATMFHNHPKGICNYCNSFIANRLPQGATLRVYSANWGGVQYRRWYRMKTYRGR